MAVTTYLFLPGTSGNYASAPDAAGLDITGDLDVRLAVALDDWTLQQDIASKIANNGTDGTFLWRISGTGLITLFWYEGGTLLSQTSSVAPTVSDGALLLIRATLDVDNGASGYDVKFWTKTSTPAAAAADLAAHTGWTQLGTTKTGGAITSVDNGTEPLEVGYHTDARFAGGDYYAFIMQDGIGAAGTAVANPDFTSDPSGSGDTSFADAAGNTWTVQQSGSPTAAILADYTLPVDPGAYGWTGTAATLLRLATITADPGAYGWTGTAATLLYHRVLPADPGAYGWTGTDATLFKSYIMAADPGAYGWTGTDAALLRSLILSVDPGSYGWTGTDAEISVPSLIIAGTAIPVQIDSFRVRFVDIDAKRRRFSGKMSSATRSANARGRNVALTTGFLTDTKADALETTLAAAGYVTASGPLLGDSASYEAPRYNRTDGVLADQVRMELELVEVL